MQSLTHELRRYRSQEITWADFYASAAPRIEQLLSRVMRVPAEDRHDLTADFYPRFVRLANDYTDVGPGFDAYLTTALRYFVRTWRRKRREREEQHDLFSGPERVEYEIRETPQPPETAALPETGPSPLAVLSNSRQRDAVRRQLFMCLCKNAPVLTDVELEYYARLMSVPRSWLQVLDAYVHSRWEHVSRRRTRYRELRDRHYAAMIRWRHGCGGNRPRRRDPHTYHRSRWLFYQDRIRRQTVHLSNREVAVLLGVSKGSVDSAMSNLARRLAALAENPVPSLHDPPASRLKQHTQAG